MSRGYQAKLSEKPVNTPKRGSNIDPPKNNNLEEFIKLCINKFGTDKAIVCLEGKLWGVQPILTDENNDIIDAQNGIAYFPADLK